MPVGVLQAHQITTIYKTTIHEDKLDQQQRSSRIKNTKKELELDE